MRNHSKPYKIAFCECPSVFPKPLTSTAFQCFRNGFASTAFQCFQNCLRLLLSGASKATAIHTA